MKRHVLHIALWSGASALLAASAVFSLAYSNLDSVSFGDIVRPLLVAMSAAVVASILVFLVHRPLIRIFPLVVYLFFAFHAAKAVANQAPYPEFIFYILVFLFLLILYILFRRFDDETKLAVYTLVIAAVTAGTMVSLAAPGMVYGPPPKIDEGFEKASLSTVSNGSLSRSELPDIIYIVPDRYPSRETLATEYGYDNSAFYRDLRARGFEVRENAWANYPKTFQSVASTLNSGYLDRYAAAYGEESPDKRPVFHVLENNVVQDRLRRAGYRFLNYGNWWEPTRVNRWAHENYQGYTRDSLLNLSEFERGLMRMTPLIDLIRLFSDLEDKRECRRIRRKFRRLSRVGNGPEPVFVFAHMLVPHEPIAMNASGNCLDRPLMYPGGPGVSWQTFKSAFVEYLKYFNAAVLKVIDTQMSRRSPSGRKLVFVIQSDEGPFPKVLMETEPQYDFSRFSERELQMKMGIINALRLPQGHVEKTGDLLTPINNWRIIFNSIFGSRMKMLPHKVFIYPTEKDLYRFCDVTAVVTGEVMPDRLCAAPPRPASADPRPRS